MKLNDFHFDLPAELIARYPLAERSASRLMYVNQREADVSHKHFSDMLDLVQPGDLLVFNNTKVIPARIFGQKITGGRIEILIERIQDENHVLAMVRSSKSPKVGDEILLPLDVRFKVLGRAGQFYEFSCSSSGSVGGNDGATLLQVIEAIGEIPLPPYLHREVEESDKERYQTVYAKHEGSVAAPTAGFHFDHALLQKLKDKQVNMGYLMLHIGAGTFAPVRVDNVAEHQMHAEYISVSKELCQQIIDTKSRGNRVIAVGTTTLRALETACRSGEIAPFEGDTNIFILPGHTFKSVDALITNLHLPHSTLLMLVSAFGGYETLLHAYKQAVSERYRFYSYGDAMWIEKA